MARVHYANIQEVRNFGTEYKWWTASGSGRSYEPFQTSAMEPFAIAEASDDCGDDRLCSTAL